MRLYFLTPGAPDGLHSNCEQSGGLRVPPAPPHPLSLPPTRPGPATNLGPVACPSAPATKYLTRRVCECTRTHTMAPATATKRILSTADERRETLLAAATIEFGARGFYGTPTTDIARAAGVLMAPTRARPVWAANTSEGIGARRSSGGIGGEPPAGRRLRSGRSGSYSARCGVHFRGCSEVTCSAGQVLWPNGRSDVLPAGGQL